MTQRVFNYDCARDENGRRRDMFAHYCGTGNADQGQEVHTMVCDIGELFVNEFHGECTGRYWSNRKTGLGVYFIGDSLALLYSVFTIVDLNGVKEAFPPLGVTVALSGGDELDALVDRLLAIAPKLKEISVSEPVETILV